MALGFNSYAAPATGFLEGFAGMDKYLIDRRSTLRQQEFNNAVRQEMQGFGSAYYDAQRDPLKRRDFYNNYPLITQNMIRNGRGGGGGRSGTGGIFGGSGRTGAFNVYGNYRNRYNTAAPTRTPQVVSTGTGGGLAAGDVNIQPTPAPAAQANRPPRVNPYGVSTGKNFNTNINPYDFQVLNGADPLADPRLSPAPNLAPERGYGT